MNKMLTETKWKILLDLINSSSKEELIWINGYLSGLVAQGNLKQDQPTTAKQLLVK
jgi:sulfite reductase (NADPH) flavoprotein alpha-component